jgi:hypothetical protein
MCCKSNYSLVQFTCFNAPMHAVRNLVFMDTFDGEVICDVLVQTLTLAS